MKPVVLMSPLLNTCVYCRWSIKSQPRPVGAFLPPLSQSKKVWSPKLPASSKTTRQWFYEKSPVQVRYLRWSKSCPRPQSWPPFPGRKATKLDLTVLVPCLKRWVVPMISTPFPAPMEMEIEAPEPLQCKGQDPQVPLILKSTLCSLRGHQRLQTQWV